MALRTLTVGIDVGGTFTDLLAVDTRSNEVKLAKVPTTVDNQAIGFMAALVAAGADPATVQAIVHGTTTTTNALLERKIAKVGLITTKGFRDVLELGRRTRPQPYGMRGTFRPLIEREYRLEVPERMDADGKILTPLDEAAVAEAAKKLLALGCEAVVVHFLHSYINPVHERRAAEIVHGLWPNGYITAGHAILSEYREYERGVTAAVNASVQPVLDRYLTRLRLELMGKGFDRDILVMQGNGGTTSSQFVALAAVNTVMSGPASGVMAAAYTGRASGHPNLITYDMGGTSTDVGLIENAVPQVSGELELEYAMPIHVPMVDVHTIGAGGGSIASVDAAGMLRVGPESAGARPGPICYGRGGTEPTITDANLVLGRLNPDRLLGVDHPVTLDHVRGIVEAKVGKPLGLDAEARGRRHPAHRQRPHGRRHPPGVAVARPRSARLRAVRLRRGGPAARHGAGARAFDSDGAGAGAGPASPMRWAASWPTCATTMSAPSTSPCRRSTMRRSRGSMPNRRPWATRRSRRKAWRCASCAACSPPTCSSRARATSCRSASSAPTSASRGCARPLPRPTTAASASSWRKSRPSWSISIPR